MRKYFSSEPEVAYFVYSAVMLVLWLWLFIPKPWATGPGSGDAALGLAPISIPWFVWSIVAAPLYVWRAIRDWRLKGVSMTILKLLVYVGSIAFLLFMLSNL